MYYFKIFVIILFLHFNFLVSEKIDPFSKIIITSSAANIKKENEIITLKYLDSVKATLADNTTVTSDKLEITFCNKKKDSLDSKELKESESKFFNQIQKINFIGNVSINSKNRVLTSKSAEAIPATQKIILKEEVKAVQTKENPRDIPLTIEASVITLDLSIDEITMSGNNTAPVTTTIEIGGYPALLKKIKTKEEKAEIKRAARREKREQKKLDNQKL